MAVTLLRAWAVLNATRRPGCEVTFEEFTRRAMRVDEERFDVLLSEGGKARIWADRAAFEDRDGEVVPMPVPEDRLAYWVERARPVKEVA